MGFDHSMNIEVDFKPGTTIDTALKAIEPLAQYRAWTKEGMMSGNLPYEDEITITESDGEISHLSIYTADEVRDSFGEIVRKVAENLNDLTLKPGFIELRDHSTGDLSNAIEHIWFGAAEEVEAAKQMHVWNEAAEQLRYSGVSDDVLKAMAALLGQTASSPIVTVIDQCGGDPWGECAQYSKEDWKTAVEAGDTMLGYWQWVISQADADQVDLASLTGPDK